MLKWLIILFINYLVIGKLFEFLNEILFFENKKIEDALLILISFPLLILGLILFGVMFKVPGFSYKFLNIKQLFRYKKQ